MAENQAQMNRYLRFLDELSQCSSLASMWSMWPYLDQAFVNQLDAPKAMEVLK